MKKLSEDKEKEYSTQIKDFLGSDAWKDYALPLIYEALQKELPAPNTKGWEDKYRYAFALSTAFTMVINSLHNLSSKKEFMDRVAKFVDEEAGKTNGYGAVDEA